MGAYTLLLQIIKYLGFPKRIINNQLRLTADEETRLNIPGPNGSLKLGTDEQFLKAQQAAIQAVKYIDSLCFQTAINIMP